MTFPTKKAALSTCEDEGRPASSPEQSFGRKTWSTVDRTMDSHWLQGAYYPEAENGQ